MNPLVQFFLSAGGAAVLAAVINAIMNRRKLSAEATEIITKAAAGTVENIMKDNGSLREEIATLQTKLVAVQQALEIAERRERGHLLQEERYRWHMGLWHSYYSKLAQVAPEAVAKVGPPPPPWPEAVKIDG